MDNFWIQHRVSESNFKLKHHMEHKYQLVFVLSGRVLYTVGDRTYTLEKGGMVVLNTLEYHSLEVLEYPYERYVLQIEPAFFQREVKYPEIISIFIRRPPGFSHLFLIPEEAWEYARLCLGEMDREYKEQKQFWEMMIGSDLRRMFVELFRACPVSFYTGKIDAGINLALKIQNYLDHHYMENITTDSIASEFFLNKHYLSHVFKDIIGYGMMEYVIILRINKAKILLTQTDDSISMIASKCGYANFTHFSKLFRKMEHCSPSEYRNKWESENYDHQ